MTTAGHSDNASSTWKYLFFTLVTILSLSCFYFLAPDVEGSTESVLESQIRDALLGITAANLETMDRNQDGKIDVADIIYLKKQPAVFNLTAGEHCGSMSRNCVTTAGSASEPFHSGFGQVPFVLKVTNVVPLTGFIDNTALHGSLYFPKENLSVTFIQDPERDFHASVTFQTQSPVVAPQDVLTRTITFIGDFTDEEFKVISGTYEENIAGFKDHAGREIAITLAGTFNLVVNPM